MENASKALIMAGGILVGVLVLSLMVYLFADFGSTSAQINAQNKQNQLSQFNSKFTAYEDKEGLTIYDVITVAGYAKENNKYYEGNDVLRSWICIPLTVGIQDRKDATIQALFSPRLWTENGLLTQAGSETFWDRSTLYALRGVYACGETEKATDYLRFYSSQRLLGEHVPYAIEAWPEGNQRHLSAESGLYCRIITEGMFGIRPTGLNSFVFTPRLPQEWDHMNLRKICAFNQVFDIEVKRLGDQLQVAVIADGKTISNRKIKEGENIRIKF